MKVDVSNFIPWSETIQNYAVTHGVSLTTAAFEVMKALKEYPNLQAINKAVIQAHQKLIALDALVIQNKAALKTLENLKAVGYTDENIRELVALVNIWSKSGIGSFNSNNGKKSDSELLDSSSNPGNNFQQPSSGSPYGKNGYGGNLSINDSIRLNLLKSTITNMLNRMGSNRTM
jgi:hypothetical protein